VCVCVCVIDCKKIIIHLSVQAWAHSKPAAAGKQEISIDCSMAGAQQLQHAIGKWANAGSATLSAYVGS